MNAEVEIKFTKDVSRPRDVGAPSAKYEVAFVNSSLNRRPWAVWNSSSLFEDLSFHKNCFWCLSCLLGFHLSSFSALLFSVWCHCSVFCFESVWPFLLFCLLIVAVPDWPHLCLISPCLDILRTSFLRLSLRLSIFRFLVILLLSCIFIQWCSKRVFV